MSHLSAHLDLAPFTEGKTEAEIGGRTSPGHPKSQNQNSWPRVTLRSGEFGGFLMYLQHNRSTWYSHSKQTPKFQELYGVGVERVGWECEPHNLAALGFPDRDFHSQETDPHVQGPVWQVQ